MFAFDFCRLSGRDALVVRLALGLLPQAPLSDSKRQSGIVLARIHIIFVGVIEPAKLTHGTLSYANP